MKHAFQKSYHAVFFYINRRQHYNSVFFNLFLFQFEFTPTGIASVKILWNFISNTRPTNFFQIYVKILYTCQKFVTQERVSRNLAAVMFSSCLPLYYIFFL